MREDLWLWSFTSGSDWEKQTRNPVSSWGDFIALYTFPYP